MRKYLGRRGAYGEKLKEVCLSSGYDTAVAVAKATGLSPYSIKQYFRGDCIPSEASLEKIIAVIPAAEDVYPKDRKR